jgi:outer membrane protein assembly factor BamB
MAIVQVMLLLFTAAIHPCVEAEGERKTGPEEMHWPQFRGPDGLGVVSGKIKYPVRVGLDKNLLWKASVPTGNSSPCVWNDRIFLTAFDKQKQILVTLALDRQTGRTLWCQQTPAVAKVENSLHPTNGPATPTPVTDGRMVYVYFGSYGLLAYDFDGNERWHKPLPAPGTMFGSGSSPILAGDRLLLTCQGKGACLLAVDPQNGATIWKKERPRFGAGYSTPVLRQSEQGAEVVLVQPRGVVAYDVKDGAERWWVGGLLGGGIPSLAQGDGLIFAVGYYPGGDPDNRMTFPSFDELIKKYDANKDGALAEKEVPADLVFFDRGSKDPKDNITMEDMFSSIAARNGKKRSRLTPKSRVC